MTNQPASSRGPVLTATGLSAGNYLVTFRATVASDDQAIECGIAQGDVNASPALVDDGGVTDKEPATFRATGVLTVSGTAQSQILFCHGGDHAWDASAPQIDFVQIGSVTQGVSG